jgi:membrane protein
MRQLVRAVIDDMQEHDVLTAASAVAFQVLTALIPLALFVLALMGFLHLESLWTDHLAPQFKAQVSKDVYTVVDDVVRRTLGKKQGWWLTAGAVLAIWEVSGATRSLMGVLSKIYDGGEDRPWHRRYPISLALGTGVTAIVLLAFASARFGGALLGGVLGFVLSWAVAVALLFTAVWLLLRYAPAHPGPHRWISFGSGLCVVAWIGTSLVFGFYATEIADYGSIFGSLATVFVLLTYLYLSAASFLIGAEVDALVREQWRG